MRFYRITAGLALSFALCLASAAAARAGCPQRSPLEILRFVVANSATYFSAIRGAPAGGGQYDLTPAAERFCPHHFILEMTPAGEHNGEYWVMKFTSSHPGTDDDVATWVLKTFGAALKARHYVLSSAGAGELGGTQFVWTGPSNTWVTVETFEDDANPGHILFETRAGRDVK